MGYMTEQARRRLIERAEAERADLHAKCRAILDADDASEFGPVERDLGVSRYHRHASGLMVLRIAYADGRQQVKVIDDSGAWRIVAESAIIATFGEAMQAVRGAL